MYYFVLHRFSSDWRLSQESVLSDMRSMQHIKEKYLNLSKSLSESDRQLSVSCFTNWTFLLLIGVIVIR